MSKRVRKEQDEDVYVMLAPSKGANDSDFRFPCIASPKIDGFRIYVKDGVARTRRGNRIANKVSDKFFSDPALEGFDGEMVVGNPAAPDVFHKTSSGLRTEKFDPQATYLVFDMHDSLAPFSARIETVKAKVAKLPARFKARVIVVTQIGVSSFADLRTFEEACLDHGFEGVIARSPSSFYKHGRASIEDSTMLKMKRFVDAEAVVIGMEEEIDKNKKPKGSMGALISLDLKSGVEFKVGTGFTAKQRAEWWSWGNKVRGLFIKYRFIPHGTKDKPRHPRFGGLRPKEDMDAAAVRRGAVLASGLKAVA